MQYPEIVQDGDGRAYLPSTYTGVRDQKVSLEYFRHLKTWTRSENFNHQVENLNIPAERVSYLIFSHDKRMSQLAEWNGFSPSARFADIVRRYVNAENIMSD